jgi:hypothetical protein
MTIRQNGGIFGRNPTFNNLTVQGTVSVPADSISGDAINGGTSTPSKITMEGSGTMLELYRSGANANFGAIAFNDTTNTGNNAKIGWNANTLRLEATSTMQLVTNAKVRLQISSAGVQSFLNDSGGTEMFFNGANLVMANGRGIDFSATPGTGTSELFSDYEEGTWTPTFTAAWTTAPTVTSAQYTKVGRQVTVTMLATNGVVTAGGGIGGLPFTSNASQGSGAYGGNNDTTESMQGTVGQSASSITNIPARTLTGNTWQITSTYFT